MIGASVEAAEVTCKRLVYVVMRATSSALLNCVHYGYNSASNERRSCFRVRLAGRVSLALPFATPDLPSRRIVLGGAAVHRSTVTRKGSNWYLGRKDYPHLGPGVYHQPSRSFLGKSDSVVYLPGSRRGFHAFLNSGRSKVGSTEGLTTQRSWMRSLDGEVKVYAAC